MVITGIAVAEPVVTAPGPVAVNVTAPAVTVRLPVPELVDTTRTLLSYRAVA